MSTTPYLLSDEPVRGAMGVPFPADWSGMDVLQAYARGEVAHGPAGHLTGLRPSEFGSGRATFVLPVSPWLQNGAGFVEPGVMALLADSPLSTAILSGAGPGRGVLTSELSVTYVQPVTRGTASLIARAATLHSNRTAGISTCQVTDAEGKLLAHASTRCVIIDVPTAPAGTLPAPPVQYGTPDPWERPLRGQIVGAEVWNALNGTEIARGYLNREYGDSPLSLLLGTAMVSAGDGEVQVEMAATPWHCSGAGTLFGGLLALLAQSSMEGAVPHHSPRRHPLRHARPDDSFHPSGLSRAGKRHRGGDRRSSRPPGPGGLCPHPRWRGADSSVGASLGDGRSGRVPSAAPR